MRKGGDKLKFSTFNCKLRISYDYQEIKGNDGNIYIYRLQYRCNDAASLGSLERIQGLVDPHRGSLRVHRIIQRGVTINYRRISV